MAWVNKAESSSVTVGRHRRGGLGRGADAGRWQQGQCDRFGHHLGAPRSPPAPSPGEGTLNYTAQATDARGNSSPALSGSVQYDTLLNTLTAGTNDQPRPFVNDAYVNKAEGANGVVLTGTVEAGATSVTVTLADGSTVSGTISGSSWTATVPVAKIANAEGTLSYSVNAVDAYGNTLATPVTRLGAIRHDRHQLHPGDQCDGR